MFERMTESVRQVSTKAQEEARGLKHPYVGIEHILLALITVHEGRAAIVLSSLGVDAEQVRRAIVAKVGKGEKAYIGQIPYRPKAKLVLKRSAEEARALGQNWIDTGHFLLALSNLHSYVEGDIIALDILEDLGVDKEQLRKATIRAMNNEPLEP